jgi:hypothetical protein
VSAVSISALSVSLGQVLIVLAGAPLLVGLMRQVRARLEGRAGAGVLQPWRDLRKLLRKEPLDPDGTGPAFPHRPGARGGRRGDGRRYDPAGRNLPPRSAPART